MTHPVAKQGIACLLVGLLLLTVGCAPQADTDGDTTTPSTTVTTFAPLQGIDLSTALTTAQVAEGLGLAPEDMAPVEVYENGISARYATRDWQTTLDISLQILTKETMELARAACEDYTPAPHLGDAAWFDEDAERLYVFFGDYQLSVYIDSADITASRLILTRHFAALVLEGLS